MIVINFAHVISEQQQQQIETLTGQPITKLIALPVQIDNQQPLMAQVEALLAGVELTQAEWESGILINPPGYAPIVPLVLAHIHGRAGHFPAMIQIRPVANSTPTRYEVADVINLQSIREQARRQR